MPENIPDRFHCQKSNFKEYLGNFTKLLDEYKVPYVNGPLIVKEAAKQYNEPMFPKGGIHWNDLGAIITANKLIEAINKESQTHIKQINFTYTWTKEVDKRARDLVDLMNLFNLKPNYYVPRLHFSERPQAGTKKSFLCWGELLRLDRNFFAKNKIASTIVEYSYLKQGKVDYLKDKVKELKEPNIVKLIKMINANDIIILEENLEVTVSHHGQLFFDTLKKMDPANLK